MTTKKRSAKKSAARSGEGSEETSDLDVGFNEDGTTNIPPGTTAEQIARARFASMYERADAGPAAPDVQDVPTDLDGNVVE